MATYYVSVDGSDSNAGTNNSPFRTINRAFDINLKPGDEVVVAPGTYNERVVLDKGGDASGNIILRSQVPGEALIRPPSSAWNAVDVYANHVTIDGFDIQGRSGDGIEANNVHHIEVLNNTVHGAGESGIQFNWSEFIRIEGNTTYDNASDGWFSGISVYQTRNITGDTTTTGFRTIIKDNVSYDNVTQSGAHTDGNGIIVDDFQSTQTGGYPNYTYPTLIENNLVYNNGGKGIAVHWTDNVTVRNNTSWHNNLDLQNDGTYRGELSNVASDNTVWVNNIAVADPSVNRNNTAIGSHSYGDAVWENNLTFNGTVGNASVNTNDGNTMPTAADGNLLGVNPQFLDAPNDFRLQTGSAAVDAGTDGYGLAITDLDGDPRALGVVDLGAYETGDSTGGGGGGGGTSNSPPTAQNDSARTNEDGSVAIDVLANDSDSDGGTLTVQAVDGSSTAGDVSVDRAGQVVYDAAGAFDYLAAGETGTDSFSYTVSDGQGGTAKGTVTVRIDGRNDAPDATDDSGFSTDAGTQIRLTQAQLLENDSDPDGDALTIISVGNTVNGNVSMAANGDILFTPTAEGEASFRYTVADEAGATANARVTVNGVDPGGPPPSDDTFSFWGDGARPATISDQDTDAVELGLKFRSDVDGEIVAIRFYRGPDNDGPHSVTLWGDNAEELSSAAAGSASGTGWQEVMLDDPVAITAGKLNIASYFAPHGGYSVSEGYFAGAMDSGPLSAQSNAGVYRYGSSDSPPDSVYKASNYWVDVVFDPTEATDRGGNGNDELRGSRKDDVMLAGSGDDSLRAFGGDDTLRGQDGNDFLHGGGGSDVLIGGEGDDVFRFNRTDHSSGDAPVEIRGGDGAIAFEGVGVRGGDVIDLRWIDADVTRAGNQSFVFGKDGLGGLTVSDDNGVTVIEGNVDRDGAPELKILVFDGDVQASSYSDLDFLLA